MRKLLALLLLAHALTYAQVKCVSVEGEASIMGNDVASAKAEAFSRAKWQAIEQVVGVQIRAESVVQNFSLLDDAVIKQITGVVKDSKIIAEEKKGDIYVVRANVCVEPTAASKAVEQLSLNNAISVLVMRRLASGRFEEASGFVESVIGTLTDREYKVYDITEIMGETDADRILSRGDNISLRELMYRSLSNLAFVGVIQYSTPAAPGQDVGYGVRMPFYIVNANLNYRIVAKETNTGKVVVLASGSERAQGKALNETEAVIQAEKELASKISPMVVERVSRYIKGLSKPVSVKFEGVKDLSQTLELKSMLQNLAWVTDVKEAGLGEFVVGYPENTLYLATALEQRGYKVVKYSPNSIILDRR